MQALTTQILKFYFKIEASVFHKTFIENLQKIPKPRSGIIEFYTSEEKNLIILMNMIIYLVTE